MILSMDIGGTAVKLGLVDEEGRIHGKREASVHFDGSQTPILTTAIREARAFLRERNIPIEGIGVSATGQIDTRERTVVGTNGKIPGYEGTQIGRELEEAFGLPVTALNDANAAALGECFAGRAKGMEDVVMLTLGTGVGGGVIIGGKIYGGMRGIAGELGHFTLYQDGEPCACGKRGCYENYASATALVRAAQRAAGETDMDGRTVFGRAAQGDARMLGVISRWLDDVAAGITGLVHIFNPRMVLIGGGISAQEKLLIEPLRQRVLSQVMPRFAQGLCLERASLSNDAGLIGAACFFMQQTRA